MKTAFLTVVLLVSLACAFAQTEIKKPPLQPLNKLDIGLAGLGASHESVTGKKSVIELAAGFGGAYSIGENQVAYTWKIFNPSIYVSVTPRWYYNLQHRIAKGKETKLNSGNYFGLKARFVSGLINPRPDARPSFLANAHWGLQRAISNKWLLNSYIGVGYAQDLSSQFGTIYPALDVKFSYCFLKGKK